MWKREPLDDELSQVLDATEYDLPHDVTVRTLADTGLRANEFAHLTVDRLAERTRPSAARRRRLDAEESERRPNDPATRPGRFARAQDVSKAERWRRRDPGRPSTSASSGSPNRPK